MRWDRPTLTVAQILAWCDAHRARTGRWPSAGGGPVEGAPGEMWFNVNQALLRGLRGLPGGDSLARLLARERGKRNPAGLPPLTEGRIVAWARAHRQATGRWPSVESGPVAGPPGETWQGLDGALRDGSRGLPGGDTLARLLARRCGKPYLPDRPPLGVAQVLAWADRHRRRTGAWPKATSGPIPGARGETWAAVNNALNRGARGLPGGTSLPSLLAEHRGKRNKSALPPLTVGGILAWADAHRARAGEWPGVLSGPIPEAPGETWKAVNMALYRGFRGLPGGDSLARLLRRRRHLPRRRGRPPALKGPRRPSRPAGAGGPWPV
jgi:hypothetical protein